jgi:hypothetical protein
VPVKAFACSREAANVFGLDDGDYERLKERICAGSLREFNRRGVAMMAAASVSGLQEQGAPANLCVKRVHMCIHSISNLYTS